MRVVLDTNIFISMALGGQMGRINDAWTSGNFILIVSDAIFSEYLDVLQRPKLHLTSETVLDILARVQRKAHFVVPTESVQAVEAIRQTTNFLKRQLKGKQFMLSVGTATY